MGAEPARRLCDRRRLGVDHEPRPPVVDDVERTAGVGRGDHRLAGEERLVGAHPKVLVDRRVEDRGARRVQLREPLRGDAALEPDASVEAAGAGDFLEPVAIGPVGDDHHVEALLERGRVE